MKGAFYSISSCCWSMIFISLTQAVPVSWNPETGVDTNLQAPKPPINNQVCIFENELYTPGQTHPSSNPCETCVCQPPGFSCTLRTCDLKPGCKALHNAGQCCPDYVCDCQKNGRTYANGEKVEEPNPCNVCYCRGGEIQCTGVTCYTRSDCEPHYLPGKCCPKYDHCPAIETKTRMPISPSTPDMLSESSSPLTSEETLHGSTKLFEKVQENTTTPVKPAVGTLEVIEIYPDRSSSIPEIYCRIQPTTKVDEVTEAISVTSANNTETLVDRVIVEEDTPTVVPQTTFPPTEEVKIDQSTGSQLKEAESTTQAQYFKDNSTEVIVNHKTLVPDSSTNVFTEESTVTTQVVGDSSVTINEIEDCITKKGSTKCLEYSTEKYLVKTPTEFEEKAVEWVTDLPSTFGYELNETITHKFNNENAENLTTITFSPADTTTGVEWIVEGNTEKIEKNDSESTGSTVNEYIVDTANYWEERNDSFRTLVTTTEKAKEMYETSVFTTESEITTKNELTTNGNYRNWSESDIGSSTTPSEETKRGQVLKSESKNGEPTENSYISTNPFSEANILTTEINNFTTMTPLKFEDEANYTLKENRDFVENASLSEGTPEVDTVEVVTEFVDNIKNTTDYEIWDSATKVSIKDLNGREYTLKDVEGNYPKGETPEKIKAIQTTTEIPKEKSVVIKKPDDTTITLAEILLRWLETKKAKGGKSSDVNTGISKIGSEEVTRVNVLTALTKELQKLVKDLPEMAKEEKNNSQEENKDKANSNASSRESNTRSIDLNSNNSTLQDKGLDIYSKDIENLAEALGKASDNHLETTLPHPGGDIPIHLQYPFTDESLAPVLSMISDQLPFLKVGEEQPIYIQAPIEEEQQHQGVMVVPTSHPMTVHMVKVVDGIPEEKKEYAKKFPVEEPKTIDDRQRSKNNNSS